MNQNRRDFFKVLAAGVGMLSLFAGRVTLAAEEGGRRGKAAGAGGGDLPLVKPGEGQAAALNYVHNNKDIKDAKLKTERSGVKFEKQSCSNCMLYSKHGMKDGAEVGKCQLFANQLVKGSGWCSSWSKKG